MVLFAVNCGAVARETIARLAEAANKANETRDRTTLLRVVNG